MRLMVLLPTEVLVDEDARKIVAEAPNGFFGLLPRHVDFVAALVPGVLTFTDADGRDQHVAVDEGVLVKCGAEVRVSVLNAVRGDVLADLQNTVVSASGDSTTNSGTCGRRSGGSRRARSVDSPNWRNVPVPDEAPERSAAERRFEENVRRKAARREHARRAGDPSVWFSLGLFGLVGWSVAIPTLLGLALGVWIDRRWPGRPSWTLMLLLAGIALGCANAWYWLKQESRDGEP